MLRKSRSRLVRRLKGSGNSKLKILTFTSAMSGEKRLEELKKALEQSFKAPDVYMFKFIVPNTNESLARVMALFDDTSRIQSKASANDNYISVTAREMMLSVDSIIEKYRSAFEIEGLIAL